MAVKCFPPCVFPNVWPSDNHNYALHSVTSHTQGCDLPNQQVADCFLSVCEVCVEVFQNSEAFRQLTSNGLPFSDIESNRFSVNMAEMTEHKLCVSCDLPAN